jgi:hypothetical protein
MAQKSKQVRKRRESVRAPREAAAKHGDHHHDPPEECCCCCPANESGADLNAWPSIPHDQMTFAEPARFGVPDQAVNRVAAFTSTAHLRDSKLCGDATAGEAARGFGANQTTVTLDGPTLAGHHGGFAVSDRVSATSHNLLALLRARPRKNQRLLSDAERRDFNLAVSMAIDAGRWEWFTNIHSGDFMMHSFMNPPFPAPPLGTYRFLPWHRVYLYRMEVWLNFFVPGVTIPYWDWANDRTLPSWVLLPPGITRGPDLTRVVATQTEINQNVLARSDYVSFTTNLEQAHNTVHMFVGGNTMPFPMVSPRDPLFFLHHANVDRIWAQWQLTPGRPEAPLTGADAVMTPFTSYDVPKTRDTFDFGYYYE